MTVFGIFIGDACISELHIEDEHHTADGAADFSHSAETAAEPGREPEGVLLTQAAFRGECAARCLCAICALLEQFFCFFCFAHGSDLSPVSAVVHFFLAENISSVPIFCNRAQKISCFLLQP